MMERRKYVLCLFNDGDARVYFAGASPTNSGKGTFISKITKRVYSYDADYLVGLAKLTRSDKWTDEEINLAELWLKNLEENKRKE